MIFTIDAAATAIAGVVTSRVVKQNYSQTRITNKVRRNGNYSNGGFPSIKEKRKKNLQDHHSDTILLTL